MCDGDDWRPTSINVSADQALVAATGFVWHPPPQLYSSSVPVSLRTGGCGRFYSPTVVRRELPVFCNLPSGGLRVQTWWAFEGDALCREAQLRRFGEAATNNELKLGATSSVDFG